MNIDSTVLDVLSNAQTEGNSLKLIQKLDRPLYVSANKVLEAAGGKWNRKAQAHLFDGDAADIMEAIILTGKVTDRKAEFGDFPSPPAVVDRLLEIAEIEQGMLALEPEAGEGSIAVPMAKLGAIVTAIEINQKHCDKLASNLFREAPYYNVVHKDFLESNANTIGGAGDLFDRIVMNPPFARQADIKHVLHALKFLAPGGRLVSVMSAGITFRTNKIYKEFETILRSYGSGGTIEALPEGSFAASGTGVNTVIVTMEKP